MNNLDAIRQRLETGYCINGHYAFGQAVEDIRTLLARLAGSQNACEDNAKRMGLLIEQLNEAKDRLAQANPSVEAIKLIAAQHDKGKAGNWAVEIAKQALADAEKG